MGLPKLVEQFFTYLGNAVAENVKKKKKKKNFGNCGNSIAKNGKKIEWNYKNVIAENRKKKKFVAEIWEEILKKVLRSQYFYNTFTTNYR